MIRARTKQSCWLLLALAMGCQGAISDDEPRSSENPEIRGAMPEGEELPEPTGPAFALSTAAPRLLPLETRIYRMAQVFELAPEDGAFDSFRDRDTALGGYNYSQQIVPDDRWSASRMALWVELLSPLCEGEVSARRYDDDTQTLLARAWGREPAADEIAEFDDALAELQPDQRARVRCIAALSAAEAVTQ
ncbi:MAG: hypothetical protein AAF938_22640 [Myxococcota bacterium]